ncbi:MAG: ribosome small subunit-dependent GTPase A [Chloroflexota bacterium]
MLEAVGWNSYFEEQFRKVKTSNISVPARVIRAEKSAYRVWFHEGEQWATLSGKLHHYLRGGELPVVGDWVVIQADSGTQNAVIKAVLPRKTQFARKAPISGGRKLGKIGGKETIIGGKTEQQVIVANIDILFCLIGADREINLRFIERMLTSCGDGGIRLVLLLNKIDVCNEQELNEIVKNISHVALDTPLHCISALHHQGLQSLNGYLGNGVTLALVGASGVGKSTLINHFLGVEQLQTGDVREKDNKGRHTTTWRDLLILPNRGAIIDTPGIREMQIWATEEDVSRTFTDIEALAQLCRFRNCTHTTEPDCAVLQAIEDRELDEKRFENYLKLQHEIHYLQSRQKGMTKREALRTKMKMKASGRW